MCVWKTLYSETGQAVELLDFDFAAPGRAIWDLAMTAGMCVPIRPPDDPLAGQGAFDPFGRLAVLARAYGAQRTQSEELVDTIIDGKKVGAAFVKRHLDAGHHGFVGMVADQEPGAYDKRLSWLRDNREHFIQTLEELL